MLEKLLNEIRKKPYLPDIRNAILNLSAKGRDAILSEFILLDAFGATHPKEEFYKKFKEAFPDKENPGSMTMGERYFLGMFSGLYLHNLSHIDYFGAGCDGIYFVVDSLGAHGLSGAKNCHVNLVVPNEEKQKELKAEGIEKPFILESRALEFSEYCTSVGPHGDHAHVKAKFSKSQGDHRLSSFTQSESCDTQGDFYGKESFPYAKNLIAVAGKIDSMYLPIDSIVIFNKCDQILPAPYDARETILMTTDYTMPRDKVSYITPKDFSKLDVFKNSFYPQVRSLVKRSGRKVPEWLEARK